MKNICLNDLKEIRGGFSIGGFLGIGAFITFLVGALDGYIRPLSCR